MYSEFFIKFMKPFFEGIATIFKNLGLGLFQMLSRENIYQYFTRFAAGAVLIAIPITILFIYMQKYYVSGITGGSVKG